MQPPLTASLARIICHFVWNSLKILLPATAISPVRFYEVPTLPNPRQSPLQQVSAPGNFSGYSSSSTDTSFLQILPSADQSRRPLPPSALRAVGHPPKPSSTSSVSFKVVSPISEIPPIDGDLYNDGDYDQLPPPPQKQLQLRGRRTPTLLPLIVVVVPQFARAGNAGPSTNIDAAPGDIKLHDADNANANVDNPVPDPGPPPPFDEQGAPPGGCCRPKC
jgi:hypothetical protein